MREGGVYARGRDVCEREVYVRGGRLLSQTAK